MGHRSVLVCLDGCAPEYLSGASILRSLGEEGYWTEIGVAMVPTVTNVNNVSLITGVYPEGHGITSNCYLDRTRGEEVYMESPDSITAHTVFEALAARGRTCALLSVKDKLCTLLNKGPQIVFSAESPPDWVVKEVGAPPSIYSIEVNPWLLRALRAVLDRFSPDFAYVGTTDYVGHKFAPEEEQAQRHMVSVDEEIGLLADRLEGSLLCVSADHGMRSKTRAVNLQAALEMAGMDSWVIPTVKDKYVVHHSNLSGSAYVYLTGKRQILEAMEVLRDVEGVEEALLAEEAGRRYRLPVGRVGDFLVLGEGDVVFGAVSKEVVSDVRIRSHGSLHERTVPIMVHGDGIDAEGVVENKDLAKIVLKYLGAD